MNFRGNKILQLREGKITYFLNFARIKFCELQVKQSFKKFDFVNLTKICKIAKFYPLDNLFSSNTILGKPFVNFFTF